ncbi:sensor histidine kinase/response regulator [Nonlabens ulvanivorans]|uniref:Sensor histidine kinase/response regulator n=1 Tax=Nonlabens ulvanivorans TaxID=906888 RepID=A0A090WFB5_NONUL|nr:two-component regulator propeller domain-containing protein [Nonlabens ulvanivorans]GAL74898.1 sensor histidine kinase/response regulator [Nonlabens ulvanivorans]
MAQISTEDGLPDLQVYRIVEDSNHFLWLATNSGTYRYDGKNFEVFYHEEQKGHSTFGITIDSQDNVWFNNAYGQIFNIVNNRVILRYEFERTPLSFIEAIDVIDDQIFISGSRDILIFNSKDYSFEVLSYNRKILPSTDIVQTNNGILTLKGEHLLNIDDNESIKEVKNLKSLLEYNTRGYLITENDQNLMVLPDDIGNSFYDLKALSKKENVFNEVKKTTINHYKKIKDKHWFLTSTGAFEYIYENDEFKLLNTYLSNYTATDVIKDFYGNLIFSTLNSGLFVIPDVDLKVLTLDSRISVRSIHSLKVTESGNFFLYLIEINYINIILGIIP